MYPGYLHAALNLRQVVASIPGKSFADQPAPAAPDYGQLNSWSAHPARLPGRAVEDANHLALLDEEVPPVSARPCDCFFVHDSCMNPFETIPFLGIEEPRWNAPLNGPAGSACEDLAAKIDEQVDWSVATDASCLNFTCRIFAPRYRQSNVLNYVHLARVPVLGRRLGDAQRAFELAYSDVRSAFLAFLDYTAPEARPFVIAGHSQGTFHLLRLLQEELEGHPARLQRFVHGYLAGNSVPMDLFGRALQEICPSSAADDLCSVSSWRTGRPGHNVAVGRLGYTYDKTIRTHMGWRRVKKSERLLGTNPVTWSAGYSPKAGGMLSCGTAHRGAAFAVPKNFDLEKQAGRISSGVSLRLGHASMRSRRTLGLRVSHLTPIKCGMDLTVHVDEHDVTNVPRLDNSLFALCENDLLLYHDLDFPLFYGNVRENVALRVTAWQQLQRQRQQQQCPVGCRSKL